MAESIPITAQMRQTIAVQREWLQALMPERDWSDSAIVEFVLRHHTATVQKGLSSKNLVTQVANAESHKEAVQVARRYQQQQIVMELAV